MKRTYRSPWLLRPLLAPLLWLILAGSVQGQAPPVDGGLAAALADLNAGRIYEAIAGLKRIARDDPAFGPAAYYLSILYTEMARYDDAERYLDRAMRAGAARDGLLHHQRGVIEGRRRDWSSALTSTERALELGMGASEADAWRHMGEIRREMFQWDAALRAYENALGARGGDPETRLALAELYLDMNEPRKAVAELNSALEAEPGLGGAHEALGRAHRSAGDLEAAVDAFEKAIERDPSDQDARYARAQTLLALGRNEEGRRALEEFQTLEALISQADTLYHTAIARRDAGALAEAERMLAEAVGLAPDYGPALEALGGVLVDRNEAGRAVAILERAVEASPLSPEAAYRLGTAYFETGRLPAALDATRRALVLDEKTARHHRQLGEIYRQMGQTEPASEAFEAARLLESLPGGETPPGGGPNTPSPER